MKSVRIGLMVLGATLLVGAIMLLPKGRDPFPFLEGQPVAHRAMLGPGSWSARELRLYTWKGDWRSVAKLARRDLPRYGLAEEPPSKKWTGALWMGEKIDGGPCGIGSDLTLQILPGRGLPMRRSSELTNQDPEWVTVLVDQSVDESWMNVVRYTLFPMPD